jgi:hypothetical protein
VEAGKAVFQAKAAWYSQPTVRTWNLEYSTRTGKQARKRQDGHDTRRQSSG